MLAAEVMSHQAASADVSTCFQGLCAVCRQALVQCQMAALGRPALHAKELGFQHPYTGEFLHFSADKPADFLAAEAALSELDKLP